MLQYDKSLNLLYFKNILYSELVDVMLHNTGDFKHGKGLLFQLISSVYCEHLLASESLNSKTVR